MRLLPLAWLSLVVVLSLIVSGCSSVQPTRKSRSNSAPPPGALRQTAASRPPGPRQPVLQITAPQSPWRVESERWYGTPYCFGGNDANGFDCSGYTSALYLRVAGMNLPRTSQQQFSMGRTVAQDDLKPGDLVFFRTPNSGAISHVGVYLGSSYFTHSSTSRGVTYNSIKESYYWHNFHGARRVVGG